MAKFDTHIEQLGAALCWRPEAWILMLVGYFDESGHPEDPQAEFFTLGGGLAKLEHWVELERGWRGVLTAEGIPATHMNALARGRKPFDDPKVWPLERRDRVVRACVDVVRSTLPRWLTCGFSLPLPPRRGETQKTYVTCFQQTVTQLLENATGYYDDGPIELVFAEHPEVPAERLAAYIEIWRHRNPRFGGLIRKPQDVPQLQFADMVVYMIAENIRRPDDRVPFMSDIMAGLRVGVRFFDPSSS